MSDKRIDLAYIGRALQRLSDEVASLRDDMQVLTAIVQRIDNNRARLLSDPSHTFASQPIGGSRPTARSDRREREVT